VLCGAAWRLRGRPHKIREDDSWTRALPWRTQARVLIDCKEMIERLGFHDILGQSAPASP
jgi:hypothetical protein